jgi:hypothetical protein
MVPKLTKQDAAVVVLECLIKSGERLFDERFDNESEIAPDNLKTLREARDTQVGRLRESLRYARVMAR